jgi:hypothetical protein
MSKCLSCLSFLSSVSVNHSLLRNTSLRHPFFLVTTILSVIGWFTAFIGRKSFPPLPLHQSNNFPITLLSQTPTTEILTESEFHRTHGSSGSIVGIAWYGIFHQLFTSIIILLAIGSDAIPEYRFQISNFLAVSVVFAVFGTNEGIFADGGRVLAIGVGWLLLAFADVRIVSDPMSLDLIPHHSTVPVDPPPSLLHLSPSITHLHYPKLFSSRFFPFRFLLSQKLPIRHLLWHVYNLSSRESGFSHYANSTIHRQPIQQW